MKLKLLLCDYSSQNYQQDFYTCLFSPILFETVSSYGSSWPNAPELLASVLRMLGIQVCMTMPGLGIPYIIMNRRIVKPETTVIKGRSHTEASQYDSTRNEQAVC